MIPSRSMCNWNAQISGSKGPLAAHHLNRPCRSIVCCAFFPPRWSSVLSRSYLVVSFRSLNPTLVQTTMYDLIFLCSSILRTKRKVMPELRIFRISFIRNISTRVAQDPAVPYHIVVAVVHVSMHPKVRPLKSRVLIERVRIVHIVGVAPIPFPD